MALASVGLGACAALAQVDKSSFYDCRFAEPDVAIAACTRLVESTREMAVVRTRAFAYRGAAWSRKREFDRALKDLDEALRLESDSVEALTIRGTIHARKGAHDKAILDFDQAIRRNPSTGPYDHRAMALAWTGQCERAIRDFDRILSLGQSANSATPLYYRAQCHGQLGRYERALEDYDRAVQWRSSDPNIRSARCFTRALLGMLEEALADCQESLRLLPDNALALHARGLVFLKLDRLDDAIADYDSALAREPRQVRSLYGRGIARQRKGDARGGSADIAVARSIWAGIAEEMARYGVR